MFACEQPPRPLNAHPGEVPPHRFPRPAPTLRSPGGATTQTEKSTQVHTAKNPHQSHQSQPKTNTFTHKLTNEKVFGVKNSVVARPPSVLPYWFSTFQNLPTDKSTPLASHKYPPIPDSRPFPMTYQESGMTLRQPAIAVWRSLRRRAAAVLATPRCRAIVSTKTMLYQHRA